MGAYLSALVVEPVLGVAIVALIILAIMKEKQNNEDQAMWAGIGAASLAIILIITNIVLGLMV